jgi:Domain of unknown function (DUF4266)
MTTPEAASPLPLWTGTGHCVALGAPPADRRSRFRRGCLVAALLAAVTLGGCAAPEPWVKPFERERLADPIMRVNRDALVAKHSEHVRDIVEASRGATGVQGGGCGCK